jgi:3-hydroxyacyl-CoA dehydrogenase
MGAGIAHVATAAGRRVLLPGAGHGAAMKAKTHIEEAVDKLVTKERLDEVQRAALTAPIQLFGLSD